MRMLEHLLGSQEPVAAEVDNERQRYSAGRYVAHMKGALLGNEIGRGEWSRYIRSLPADSCEEFFGEVDALIERGELWQVLTPEEKADCVRQVLARKDEIQSDASRPMHRSEMDAGLRNELFQSADRMPTHDELLGLPSFPDIGEDNDQDKDQDQDQDQGTEDRKDQEGLDVLT